MIHAAYLVRHLSIINGEGEEKVRSLVYFDAERLSTEDMAAPAGIDKARYLLYKGQEGEIYKDVRIRKFDYEAAGYEYIESLRLTEYDIGERNSI